MADLSLPGCLVALGALYVGAVTHEAAISRRRLELLPVAAFLVGVSMLALALVSPLDGAAERRLPWHMVQHLLLVSIAGPLLAFGRPTMVLAKILGRAKSSPLPPERRFWLTALAAVTMLVILLGWHVPPLYERAVHDETVHAIEHLSLLTSAFLFWETLYAGGRSGATVLWLFIVTLPMTFFGFVMTVARSPWYLTYATHSTADALRDQQLAGVIMWSFGGLATLIGAVVSFAAWLAGAPPVGRVQTEKALS